MKVSFSTSSIASTVYCHVVVKSFILKLLKSVQVSRSQIHLFERIKLGSKSDSMDGVGVVLEIGHARWHKVNILQPT